MMRHRRRSSSLIFSLLLILSPLSNAQDPQISDQPINSNHAPVLQVSSTEGFLTETAEMGTTVRVSPNSQSESLQILVNDEDLVSLMLLCAFLDRSYYNNFKNYS